MLPRPQVMRLEVDQERRIICASYTEFCPVPSIAVRKSTASVDQDACAVCGACLTVRPEDAPGILEQGIPRCYDLPAFTRTGDRMTRPLGFLTKG